MYFGVHQMSVLIWGCHLNKFEQVSSDGQQMSLAGDPMSYAQEKASLGGVPCLMCKGDYTEVQCIINLSIGTFIKICFIFSKKYFIFSKFHYFALFFTANNATDFVSKENTLFRKDNKELVFYFQLRCLGTDNLAK